MARAVPSAADAAGRLADPATTAGGGPFVCLECQEPVSLRREHLPWPELGNLPVPQPRLQR